MSFINWNNTTRTILYGTIFIITIIIIAKLYTSYKYHNIESFESSISKFKSKQKKESMSDRSNSSNSSKSLKDRLKQSRGNNKRKNNSRDITFDDVIKESESIDVNKYTLSSLKSNFWDYVGSFKADKFTNITGTNNEALDKLYLFRDKFFEIFE